MVKPITKSVMTILEVFRDLPPANAAVLIAKVTTIQIKVTVVKKSFLIENTVL